MTNSGSFNCSRFPRTLSSPALHTQKHRSTHEAVASASFLGTHPQWTQRCHKEDDLHGGCALRNGLKKIRNKMSSNDEPRYVSLNSGDPYTYPGRKRALLCGVSYENKKYRLKGPLNDVKMMKDFLMQSFHYREESILVLTEKEEEDKFKPTRRNIQNAFKWLVKDLQENSRLVFYYTGHGHRQIDLDNDEHDGFDETICPMDFEEAGMILDDEINDTIVRPLTKGVKLHAIIDSCHSGTMLDLTYVYEKKKNNAASKWIDNTPPSGANKRTSGGLAICISACTDAQLAADTTAFSKKETGGALTYNLIAAVKENRKITYGELLNFLQDSFPKIYGSNKFSRMLRKVFKTVVVQDPQLSSSKNFDIFAKRFKL